MSSSAMRMRNRGPENEALLSSWSRTTWQTSWQRKHSMHLRNSWLRSTSTCCMRYSPGATPSGGLNAWTSRAVSFHYEKAREVPAVSPPEGVAPGEYRMQQVDVERSQEFRKCIECFLCQDVCHVVRDHEDNKASFSGPRFLMRIAELDMHPLDSADRRPAARAKHGLGCCNITKCCTEVCPEHIHITDNALIPLKERVVDRHYDPVVWLGNKIRRRNA